MDNLDDTGHFVQICRRAGSHYVYLHTYEPTSGRRISRSLVVGVPCKGDESAARTALRLAARRAVRDALKTESGTLQAATVRAALRRVMSSAQTA